MRYRFDWVIAQSIIAFRADLRKQISNLSTREVLNHIPEAYFCGDTDYPPSMPVRGYIEISVPVGAEVGFDLRKIDNFDGWTVQIDDGNPLEIKEGTQFMTVQKTTSSVLFLWRGSKHTLFKIFYEEDFSNEGTHSQ